ncbi:glycosyltransferase [Polluticoccus soli]|uniref:glycosyltransferase n=1 Tax=Polluticoccus soli TaxID=3034150 RepID=UPI0023E33FD0|nr:glycosyltransferase [Flavipsychrobacter sp. JY13-12]
MNSPKNIVYLYSEVLPYAITTMRALRDNFNANIDCISWDKNKVTPFVPQDMERIRFHKRSEFNKQTLINFIESRRPDVLCISGRMDGAYLDVAVHFRAKGVPVISGCDNQWYGSVKNWVAALFSRYIYHRYFDYFWVPGRRQFEFAKRIGYSNKNILGYALSADVDRFRSAYEARKMQHAGKFPRTIVYAGRFSQEKGIEVLVKAFTEFKSETTNDWKLVLVGAGPVKVESTSDIQVLDYMTPDELVAKSSDFGVFCLPSIWDHWGVVIHEFTAAGMPMISSDGVGAADTFIIEGFNGYLFKSRDVNALKAAFVKMTSKTDEELWEMGDRSFEISETITPTKAAHSFMSVLDKSVG